MAKKKKQYLLLMSSRTSPEGKQFESIKYAAELGIFYDEQKSSLAEKLYSEIEPALHALYLLGEFLSDTILVYNKFRNALKDIVILTDVSKWKIEEQFVFLKKTSRLLDNHNWRTVHVQIPQYRFDITDATEHERRLLGVLNAPRKQFLKDSKNGSLTRVCDKEHIIKQGHFMLERYGDVLNDFLGRISEIQATSTGDDITLAKLYPEFCKHFEEFCGLQHRYAEAEVINGMLTFQMRVKSFLNDTSSPDNPLNMEQIEGEWIPVDEVADIEGIRVKTLNRYRPNGTKEEDGLSGIDPYGRKWRKTSDNSHVLYLKSSLVKIKAASMEAKNSKKKACKKTVHKKKPKK